MTGRAGQRTGDELWLRCPFCGDSQRDLNKAHYSVNREGLYHCLRCGVGGRLQLKHYLSLIMDDHADLIEDPRQAIDWEDTLDEIIPGGAYTRHSALDRFHLATPTSSFDVFLSRNTDGDITGLALADLEHKRRLIVGQKLFGWKGEALISSPRDPLRLVEGPYDVVTSRDVCTYGLPTKNNLRELTGHFIILCPDGDVWADYTKRTAIMRLFGLPGATVLRVEILEDGQDPDQVAYGDRVAYTVKEVNKQWPTRNLRSQIKQSLKSS